MENAILKLNSEIEIAVKKLNSLAEQDEFFARPYKLWIYFLTDHDEKYDETKC
jgi:hypothetical protein